MPESGLKPNNIIQAAHADMERRARNEARAADPRNYEPYEQYAFHRDHVKIADGAFGLILLALMDDGVREKVEKTTKRSTKRIYRDGCLLAQAMRMEK